MMQYRINPVFRHIVKPDYIEYCTVFSFLKYKSILKMDYNVLNLSHNIKEVIHFFLSVSHNP